MDKEAQYHQDRRLVAFRLDTKPPQRVTVSERALWKITGQDVSGKAATEGAYRQHWEQIHRVARAHPSFGGDVVALQEKDF